MTDQVLVAISDGVITTSGDREQRAWKFRALLRLLESCGAIKITPENEGKQVTSEKSSKAAESITLGECLKAVRIIKAKDSDVGEYITLVEYIKAADIVRAAGPIMEKIADAR